MSRSAAGGCVGSFVGVLLALGLITAAVVGVFILVCGGMGAAIDEAVKKSQQERANKPVATNEGDKAEEQPASEVPANKLTLANFYDVKTGMSFDEVTAKIGDNCEITSEAEFAGHKTSIVTWKGSWGANCNVTFQDGRVIGKAQFGLK